MNIVLISILIIIVLLLIVLIYLLNTNKDTKNSEVKSNTNPEIKMKELSFPKNIEQMDRASIIQASKVIIDSYKALASSSATLLKSYFPVINFLVQLATAFC